jgi:DNA polymerase-1
MRLLVDADILLYRLAASSEVEIRWTPDLHTLHSDPEQIKEKLKDSIKAIEERLEADYAILCFSDGVNFRKSVYPDYKGNRRGQRKPLAYGHLKEWCLDTFPCEMRPTLEADDVMGIMSTKSPGEYIIVSDDKDLKQIPGLLFRDNEIQTITDHQGLEYFFTQVLTGDPTDGYPGCPGIGAVTAQKALGSIRFIDVENYTQAAWKAVVDLYARQKLTPEDALVQARCARMLTHKDWDFEKQEVILWDCSL